MKDESVWGVELLGGIAVLIFGIAAVFWPGITLLTLLYLFSAYVLVAGIINLFSGIFSLASNVTVAILKLLLGMLMLGVGVYLLRHPAVTFATFILLIGFTFIFRGVFDVVEAFVGEQKPTSRTLSMIVGLLGVLVGVIMLFQPAASGVAFVWLLGLYGLIAGPLMIATSIEDHKS